MKGMTKLAIYLGCGAVLALGVYLFLLSPSMGRLVKLSQEEQKTRTEILRLEQQILAYKTAQSDLSKAESKELLYTSIVDDEQLFLPIESLEAAAEETNSTHTLKILRDSIVPDPEENNSQQKRVTEHDELEEIPYTLTVQNTNYTQLVRFFKYLEHNPYHTELSQIDVSYAENPLTKQFEFVGSVQGVFLVNKYEPKE